MKYIEEAKAVYAKRFPEASAHVKPCSEPEILELERRFQHTLPQAYREFLAWMGRGGDFWIGFDWRDQMLGGINMWARELVDKSGKGDGWPGTAFVFVWDP